MISIATIRKQNDALSLFAAVGLAATAIFYVFYNIANNVTTRTISELVLDAHVFTAFFSAVATTVYFKRHTLDCCEGMLELRHKYFLCILCFYVFYVFCFISNVYCFIL